MNLSVQRYSRTCVCFQRRHNDHIICFRDYRRIIIVHYCIACCTAIFQYGALVRIINHRPWARDRFCPACFSIRIKIGDIRKFIMEHIKKMLIHMLHWITNGNVLLLYANIIDQLSEKSQYNLGRCLSHSVPFLI